MAETDRDRMEIATEDGEPTNRGLAERRRWRREVDEGLIQALITSETRARVEMMEAHLHRIEALETLVEKQDREARARDAETSDRLSKLISRVLIATGVFLTLVFFLEWLGPVRFARLMGIGP